MANTPLSVDIKRAKELRKYFVPNSKFVHLDNGSGPQSQDAILKSLVHLVSLRLGYRRAVISLVDADTQYFLAEGTRSLDINNPSVHDDGDGLWAGCAQVSKSGRLCERTLEASRGPNGEPPFFMSGDMLADDRFKHLPFVTGEPHFRCYLGVPLISKLGISIGSLFVIDEQPRLDAPLTDVTFLTTIAETIVIHLTTTRDAAKQKRSIIMTRGLSAFVDSMTRSSHNVGDRARRARARAGQKQGIGSLPVDGDDLSPFSMPRGSYPQGQIQEIPRERSHQSTDDVRPDTTAESTRSRSNSGPQQGISSFIEAQNKTYFKAASMIRGSLEANGVIFVDTTVGYVVKKNKRDGASADEIKAQRLFTSASFDIQNPTDDNSSVKAALMSYSIEEAAGMDVKESLEVPQIDRNFNLIDESALRYITMVHSKGNLWVLDEYGAASSSSDEGPANDERDKTSPEARYDQGLFPQIPARRPEFENTLLADLFPSARQVLFYPLFDPVSQRPLAGCFVWSTHKDPAFTKSVELTFLKTFLNNVSSEIRRLDAMYADEQKSHFISSISHELRSPLHGILGASEFLREASLTDHQLGLVETIESSGKTLLDTVNSILDYSKINSFTTSGRRKSAVDQGAYVVNAIQPGNPANGLSVPVNLAILCEEVSDGALAGFIFSGFSSDLTDRTWSLQANQSDDTRHGSTNAEVSKPAFAKTITIVLDIEAGNWNFVTEPGALRRILMNLIGNSLKFTPSAGYICISLKSQESHGPLAANDPVTAVLTISDNGRGISNNFLKQSLFLPFTQESALSTGLGLGMSIVRSIVSSMNGQVEVRSQLGVGTDIIISLPLKRIYNQSNSEPSSAGSHASLQRYTDSFNLEETLDLIKEAGCRHVSIFGFENSTEVPQFQTDMVKRSITRIVTSWIGTTCSTCEMEQDKSVLANLVIVNEPELDNFLVWEHEKIPESSRPPIVVVYDKTRRSKTTVLSTETLRRSCALASHPIGPMKLSRAILFALGGSESSKHTIRNVLDQNISPVDQEVKLAAKEAARLSGKDVPYFNTHPAMEATHDELLSPSWHRAPGLTDRRPSTILDTLSLQLALGGGRTISNGSRQAVDSGPRVLLVDDNVINLRLIEMFTRRKECREIEKAENGLQAVEANQRHRFDIIFMDLSMPVMNGFDAVRAIRQTECESKDDCSEVPAFIVALTGLASRVDRAAAFEAGVDQYVTKPVKFAEVGRIIDRWINHRSAEDK